MAIYAIPMRILRWIRRRWKVIVPTVVAGYALLVAFVGCADLFLLFPSQGHQDAPDAAERLIAAPLGSVDVWTARSPGAGDTDEKPAAYVLCFEGQGNRVEPLAAYDARRWGNLPVEVWDANYPGFGKSTGPGSLKSIPPAALAAYDGLKKVAGEKPIFVAANSLGCTAALYVASQRPVAGVVLQSVPALHQLIMDRNGWWNLWLAAIPIAAGVPTELEALQTAPRVHAPAVFLVTDADGYVPPPYQQRVINAYAGEKRVVHLAGGHNATIDPAAQPKFDEALKWLWMKAGLNALNSPEK